MADLEPLNLPTLSSRKIWVREKISNFPHCGRKFLKSWNFDFTYKSFFIFVIFFLIFKQILKIRGIICNNHSLTWSWKKVKKFVKSNLLCITQCGNYANLLSHIFGKSFVKITVLLKKLLNSCFDEILFLVRENFSFFHFIFWQKFHESNVFTKD